MKIHRQKISFISANNGHQNDHESNNNHLVIVIFQNSTEQKNVRKFMFSLQFIIIRKLYGQFVNEYTTPFEGY